MIKIKPDEKRAGSVTAPRPFVIDWFFGVYRFSISISRFHSDLWISALIAVKNR
jgi:hypothetical protein